MLSESESKGGGRGSTEMTAQWDEKGGHGTVTVQYRTVAGKAKGCVSVATTTRKEKRQEVPLGGKKKFAKSCKINASDVTS